MPRTETTRLPPRIIYDAPPEEEIDPAVYGEADEEHRAD